MSFNQADQLMRGAPVKYVAGRTSPTTASFKKNFGRVSVPGMADVMFNLRDWFVHKKSFHRPDRPSPLEVLAASCPSFLWASEHKCAKPRRCCSTQT